MKDLEKKIREYIEAHTEEMIEDIRALCRINSVKSEAKEGMPYGEGAFAALMEAERICRGYGFATRTYSERVISADLNAGESCLDILGHMDVVPEGEGWTKTAPFEPVVIDEAIYGRGTADDKGPSVAALYAMKAVKELGIPVTKNCRLILGSDEECGSSDIPYYYAVEEEAPMTFSPDAEFPLINVEKGQFRGTVVWKLPADGGTENAAAENISRKLLSMESGATINIVPRKAKAELMGFTAEEIRQRAVEVKKELQVEFSYELSELKTGVTELHILGEAAHASTPEKGVNAGVIMLKLLSGLGFDNIAMCEKLQLAAKLFPYGDYEGWAAKLAGEDEVSGKTSVSPDIFRIDEQEIRIQFDARTCASMDEEGVREVKEYFETLGCEFTYTFVKAHVVDGNSAFVQTLLKTYEEVTGREGRCIAIGGGTYVHDLKNGVAFGAVGEDTDAHMHGADEFLLISELQDAAVIYALCIASLCE